MDMQAFRKKYPQYNEWSDQKILTAINKKNSAKKKEPELEKETGWGAVANDVGQSFAGLPEAAFNMIPSIAQGAAGAVGNIAKHPLKSALNFGAGMGEGAIAMEHIPANIAQYLADKGVMSKKDAETYQKYKIPNLGIEKALGIEGGDKGDQFLKTLGSFLIPGKIAKAALPARAALPAAASALAAGENQDPLQAAMVALLGAHATRAGINAVKRVPSVVNKAAGVVPPPPSAPLPSAPPPPVAGGAPVSPLPIQPAAAPQAGISWNAQPANSVSWMKNIPQAALNVAKEGAGKVKKTVNKIPEVSMNAAASGLELGADAMSKIPGLGKVAQPSLGAAASYLKYLAVPPEEMAQRKMFGDIKSKDLPRIMERVEAAKRAGIEFITPAEGTLRALEGAKQGTIGRTTAGMDLLNERGEARTASEVKSVEGLLDLIHDEKLKPQMKAAYDSTMTGRVTNDFIDKYKNMPVIEEAMSRIENNPAYRQIIEKELGIKLKSVNPKTFMYWDIVKRVLGDLEEKKKETGKATTESSEYGKTRRAMVTEMDAIKPEYKVARKISERQKTREKLEKHFNTREMTLNELKKYLKNKTNYKDLVHKLEPFPEATQRLKDLHLLGGDLIPNNMNIRAAAALKKTSMSDARNQLDAAKRDLDERFGQSHDVEAVKLMTDPDWHKALIKYLNKKGK